MSFADNWARVFVVITFLTFGEAQIIGGIVPNLIAFTLFLGAIGYFASTGKMAEMFGWKNKKGDRSRYWTKPEANSDQLIKPESVSSSKSESEQSLIDF